MRAKDLEKSRIVLCVKETAGGKEKLRGLETFRKVFYVQVNGSGERAKNSVCLRDKEIMNILFKRKQRM